MRLSDEQRAQALEWARRLDEECPSGHWPYHRLALDLADELAAAQRENAELRRMLGMYVAIGDSEALEDHMGQQPEASMLWDEMYHKASRLLAGDAGEVQDADVSPPVKLRPGTATIHAHDCPCWACEGYREDMAREVHDAAE